MSTVGMMGFKKNPIAEALVDAIVNGKTKGITLAMRLD